MQTQTHKTTTGTYIPIFKPLNEGVGGGGGGGGKGDGERRGEREKRNNRETKSHIAYTQEGRIVTREPGAHADHHLQLPASPMHFFHLGFRAPNPNPMRTKP